MGATIVEDTKPDNFETLDMYNCISRCISKPKDCEVLTWHYESYQGRHDEGLKWEHKCVYVNKKEATKLDVLDPVTWDGSPQKCSHLVLFMVMGFIGAACVLAGLYTKWVGLLLAIV